MVGLGFPDGSVVKNPPANAGDMGSMYGSRRFPGGEHGNPLQCSCLENQKKAIVAILISDKIDFKIKTK